MNERIGLDSDNGVSLYRNEGNLYVTVRTPKIANDYGYGHHYEHHSTTRAKANALVKTYNKVNGTNLVVNAYIGLVFSTDATGYGIRDKRFTVVDMG